MLAGTACQVLKYFFTDKGTWELDEGKAKMIYQWEEPGILTRYPEKKEFDFDPWWLGFNF